MELHNIQQVLLFRIALQCHRVFDFQRRLRDHFRPMRYSAYPSHHREWKEIQLSNLEYDSPMRTSPENAELRTLTLRIHARLQAFQEYMQTYFATWRAG